MNTRIVHSSPYLHPLFVLNSSACRLTRSITLQNVSNRFILIDLHFPTFKEYSTLKFLASKGCISRADCVFNQLTIQFRPTCSSLYLDTGAHNGQFYIKLCNIIFTGPKFVIVLTKNKTFLK